MSPSISAHWFGGSARLGEIESWPKSPLTSPKKSFLCPFFFFFSIKGLFLSLSLFLSFFPLHLIGVLIPFPFHLSSHLNTHEGLQFIMQFVHFISFNIKMFKKMFAETSLG